MSLKSMTARSLLAISAVVLLACSKTGVQGTSLYKSFKGIEGSIPLSPTAVRLTWSLDSTYKEYKVYQDQSVSPIATEQFANKVVAGLVPATSYTFEVTGVELDGTEKVLSNKQTVSTYPSFEGLKAEGLTLKSPTEVNVTWSVNAATASYKIFVRAASASFDLNQPAGTVVGENQYIVTGLTSGQTYCFHIQAQYLDGTFEPSATTQVDLDSVDHCVQLTSQIQELPSVNVSSKAPGVFPWFWATNGNESYKIDVFDLSSNARVASRVGNGTFRSFVRINPKASVYYAEVSDGVGIARVPVSIDGKSEEAASVTRDFLVSGQKGPILPSLINDGNGQQNLGDSVVTGDFNCDGYQDVAVSMPTATIVSSTSHFKENGAVAVYYSAQQTGQCFNEIGDLVACPYRLVTSPAPSMSATFPNPQLITYTAPEDLTRIGKKLAVGNFNGDCYERHPSNERGGSCNELFRTETIESRMGAIRSCDDLVIAYDIGEINVLYGDPTSGLISGSGANTAGLNEFTCDATSNTCRVGRYTPPSGYDVGGTYAAAMTTGDFNNDSYDELALTMQNTSLPTFETEIAVMRGSPQGLYPHGAPGSHENIKDAMSGLTTLNWGGNSDNFGEALAAVFDSRLCLNGGGITYRTLQPALRAGYDLSKCDDIVIGAPARKDVGNTDPTIQRGSIFSCRSVQLPGTQQISSWTCREHWPDELEGKHARYGQSLHGARNFNGYPVSSFNLFGGAVPNITGALFVGAPEATVDYGGNPLVRAGRVYAYYVTPKSTDNSSGGIGGILGTGVHVIKAVNSLACDRLNAREVTGGVNKHCKHQVIHMWPPEAGAQFGYSLSSIPVLDSANPGETSQRWLSVGVPYKAGVSLSGSTVAAAGAVYLYRPDVSNLGMDSGEEVKSPKYNAAFDDWSGPSEGDYGCTSSCTWYSGGVSPYGPTLVTRSGLNASANLGLSPAAGADFNNDSYSDLLVSAPNSDVPTPRNGGLFLYYSDLGFDPSISEPDLDLSPNISLEGNYDFQEIRAVGDLNGDSYEDAATHINANGVWNVIVYYGSLNGLIKEPAPSENPAGNQPLRIRDSSDLGFGKNLFPAGDVNGDGYSDVLIIGSSASYLYYGSSTGLVTTPAPTTSPIGKGPLRFARAGNWSSGFIDFSGDSRSGWSNQLSNPAYNSIVSAVTSADFNEDGYDDMAIRLRSSISVPGVSMGSLSFNSDQTGRVVVIYGGLNGPQTDRLTGRIRYSINGAADDVVVEDPCATTGDKLCQIQLLGPPHSDSTIDFGFAVTAIKKRGSPNDPLFNRLAISEPDRLSGKGAVYIYEGSQKGLKASIVQTLVPKGDLTSENFGFQTVDIGDINGDEYSDLAVSTAHSSKSRVYVFYGSRFGLNIGYFGASNITDSDYWVTSLSLNSAHADAAVPRPQYLRPSGLADGKFFGWGMTPVGDFNNDGFQDLAINVPNGDSTISGTISNAGFVAIYFGSQMGLQGGTGALSPYPRCYRGVAPLCDLFQLLLPAAVPFENTHINPFSAGDFDGDGFKDVAVGGVGRDLVTPGKRTATSAGVIYVVY